MGSSVFSIYIMLELLRLTAERLKYRMLIRSSSGAASTEKKFFARKRVVEAVMSAREPQAKVSIASDRPTIVRY